MCVDNNYVSCSLYFLHLFRNFIQLVHVHFTPVQLFTFILKNFCMPLFHFLLSTAVADPKKMKRGVQNHHSRGLGGCAPQMLKGIFIFTWLSLQFWQCLAIIIGEFLYFWFSHLTCSLISKFYSHKYIPGLVFFWKKACNWSRLSCRLASCLVK